MFKGIVEGTGRIRKRVPVKAGMRLTIESSFSLKDLKIGDSVAVNGCCLTAVSKNGKSFDTDLSPETLNVTSLGALKAGDAVNLERAMRLSDRIDGHLVQGHVDGLGKILKIRAIGDSWEIEVALPKNLRRYLIPKGSIAVDGISMTVNRLKPASFTLCAIPHTFQATNLKHKKVGDPVNLEVDLMGKYMESFLKKL